MFSKSRLTPARIKVWVSLLSVMTAWTSLILHMLIRAHWLELAAKTSVLSLNDKLVSRVKCEGHVWTRVCDVCPSVLLLLCFQGDLVESSWDLSLYLRVLEYWSTRCLPPRSPGILTLLGMVQVQDLVYYLQYYSLPVFTAILAPFVRVILALKRVYSL